MQITLGVLGIHKKKNKIMRKKPLRIRSQRISQPRGTQGSSQFLMNLYKQACNSINGTATAFGPKTNIVGLGWDTGNNDWLFDY